MFVCLTILELGFYGCCHPCFVKDYAPAIDVPMGTIKFSYIEAGAHIHPHTGGYNYRLRKI